MSIKSLVVKFINILFLPSFKSKESVKSYMYNRFALFCIEKECNNYILFYIGRGQKVVWINNKGNWEINEIKEKG